ncbi:MAG: HEAT repeat domain-containing protein [Campylobacter curvus]
MKEILCEMSCQSLGEFRAWLEEIKNGKRDDELKFTDALGKSEFISYHYDLLFDKNLSDDLRLSLEIKFKLHAKAGEDMLLEKLQNATDDETRAKILFMLGAESKFYKDETLKFARKFTKSSDDALRQTAIIVLGWLGGREDLSLLRAHLLNDENAKCRAWSASSFMQMWFRKENEILKKTAFESFQKALEIEHNTFVLACILDAIRQIGKTKLGISQRALDELNTAEINAAKARAMRFLNKTS